MDDFDRLLKSLPPDRLPPGLTGRTRARFRQRRQRQQRLQAAASLALLLLGVWLGGPGLLSLGAQLQTGATGPSLLGVMTSSLFDAGAAFSTYSFGSSSIQTALSSSLGVTAWIGILALAAGAWIGISSMLSRTMRWQ